MLRYGRLAPTVRYNVWPYIKRRICVKTQSRNVGTHPPDYNTPSQHGTSPNKTFHPTESPKITFRSGNAGGFPNPAKLQALLELSIIYIYIYMYSVEHNNVFYSICGNNFQSFRPSSGQGYIKFKNTGYLYLWGEGARGGAVG